VFKFLLNYVLKQFQSQFDKTSIVVSTLIIVYFFQIWSCMHLPCVLGKLLDHFQVTGLCISCDIDRFQNPPKGLHNGLNADMYHNTHSHTRARAHTHTHTHTHTHIHTHTGTSNWAYLFTTQITDEFESKKATIYETCRF
jgi:hypothetical protein